MKQKLIIMIIAMVMALSILVGFTVNADALVTNDTNTIKDTTHEIAELARSLGLSEDDPIIVRAKELWIEADEREANETENINQFNYDRDIIATVIYNEAWYGCSIRHRELVAAVVCNRVKSNLFPDSVYDVVTAPRQYIPAYVDPDSYYGKRARANADAWALCQEIATRALRGEIDCPENVVFQSEFKNLGDGVYEMHRTSYSTTYFCYVD